MHELRKFRHEAIRDARNRYSLFDQYRLTLAEHEEGNEARSILGLLEVSVMIMQLDRFD